MPTVAEIILYAKVSQQLAVCDINNQKYLKGGAIDERLPLLLYIVRKDVEWLYELNPSDPSLRATANYLYALCGQYALEAQYTQGNNAGTVVPTPVNNTVRTSVNIQRVVPFTYPTINLGNIVAGGTTTLEIRDAGIDVASFVLTMNGQELDEGLDDQLSYTNSYTNNIFTIIFNQALADTNRLRIRYEKNTAI